MKERGITGDVSRSIIRIWTRIKSTVEFSPYKRVFPRLSMTSQTNSGNNNNNNGSQFCDAKCEKREIWKMLFLAFQKVWRFGKVRTTIQGAKIVPNRLLSN